MSSLERYIEQYPETDFGFACCGTVWKDNKNYRCGRKTHRVLIIGANRVPIPYCDEHMPKLEDC